MITKPTVLILGAGASSAYGFPLGRGLRDDVCSLLQSENGSRLIVDEGYDLEQLRSFSDTLRHSGYTSVDWFLEDFTEFIEVGKAAIAAVMIPCELPDLLFPPGARQEHWYELLLNTLDTPRGEFSQNKLSIITFNYDRSLEHYLWRVLETRRGSEQDAIDDFNSLEIVHVHGSLGELAPIVKDGRPYSASYNAGDIRKASEKIIVVGEASEDTEAFSHAKALLMNAQRIVFLGFGYHAKSVFRLGVFNEPWDEGRRQNVQVGGTVKSIPDHKWQKIRSDVLNEAFPARGKKSSSVFRYLNEIEPLD